jgi:hypothetical protein
MPHFVAYNRPLQVRRLNDNSKNTHYRLEALYTELASNGSEIARLHSDNGSLRVIPHTHLAGMWHLPMLCAPTSFFMSLFVLYLSLLLYCSPALMWCDIVPSSDVCYGNSHGVAVYCFRRALGDVSNLCDTELPPVTEASLGGFRRGPPQAPLSHRLLSTFRKRYSTIFIKTRSTGPALRQSRLAAPMARISSMLYPKSSPGRYGMSDSGSLSAIHLSSCLSCMSA